MEAHPVDEGIEADAHAALTSREDQSRTGEEFVQRGPGAVVLRGSDEADGLVRQGVGDPAGGRVPGRGPVRQEDVQVVRLQILHQVCEVAGMDDDIHVLPTEERSQEPELEVPGEGGLGPHPEDDPVLPLLLEGAQEVLAEREDRVGVIQGDAACLGEDQLAPSSLEQLAP